jgi:hypothetical protein
MHIAGKIRCAKDRIKADGIQVDHFTGVTGVCEPFGELLENGMAKALGIRMCIYCQDSHRISLHTNIF